MRNVIIRPQRISAPFSGDQRFSFPIDNLRGDGALIERARIDVIRGKRVGNGEQRDGQQSDRHHQLD